MEIALLAVRFLGTTTLVLAGGFVICVLAVVICVLAVIGYRIHIKIQSKSKKIEVQTAKSNSNSYN